MDRRTLTNADVQVVVGVAAVWREEVDGAPTAVGKSPIAWSDAPEACAGGETFGIYYYAPPSPAAAFRLE